MVSKLFSLVLLMATIAYARDCTWFGSAPLCNGHCESPHSFQVTRGEGGGGNGAICASGHKVFCCTQSDAGAGCSWHGTAPLCAGKCPPGTEQVTTDGSGDGDTCLSGNKVYCCPSGTEFATNSSAVHHKEGKDFGDASHHVAGQAVIGKASDL